MWHGMVWNEQETRLGKRVNFCKEMYVTSETVEVSIYTLLPMLIPSRLFVPFLPFAWRNVVADVM